MNIKKLFFGVLLTIMLFTVANTTANAKAADISTKKATTGSAITKKRTVKKATKAKKKYSKAQLRLMSCIINAEAGNQSYQGKLAVGIVVMNRVRSKSFPGTIHGVVYQPYQFSPVRNGSLRLRFAEYDSGKTTSTAWKQCIKAAKAALNGEKSLTINGIKKNFKTYYFFSVSLSGARFRLGGHMFK